MSLAISNNKYNQYEEKKNKCAHAAAAATAAIAAAARPALIIADPTHAHTHIIAHHRHFVSSSARGHREHLGLGLDVVEREEELVAV